jgi:hypothetical protein
MTDQALILREDAVPMLTALDVVARVNLIQKIKATVMQKGVHYGRIPGTNRDSLWQAGAEVLKVAFGISVRCEPIEERVTDEEVFYRVRATAYNANGRELGSREAVCSTREKKYRWRRPIHPKEFEAADSHMRRITWDKDTGNEILLVRTDPGDLIETILGMANKRADVAVTRSVTGCSDMFEVSWEEGHEDDDEEARPPVQQPRAAAPAEAAAKAGMATLPTDVPGGPAPVKVAACKKVKSGENEKGEPWTLYSVTTSAGQRYSTFSLTVYAAAQKALAEGSQVYISATAGAGGKDPLIDEIRII